MPAKAPPRVRCATPLPHHHCPRSRCHVWCEISRHRAWQPMMMVTCRVSRCNTAATKCVACRHRLVLFLLHLFSSRKFIVDFHTRSRRMETHSVFTICRWMPRLRPRPMATTVAAAQWCASLQLPRSTAAHAMRRRWRCGAERVACGRWRQCSLWQANATTTTPPTTTSITTTTTTLALLLARCGDRCLLCHSVGSFSIA